MKNNQKLSPQQIEDRTFQKETKEDILQMIEESLNYNSVISKDGKKNTSAEIAKRIKVNF